MAVLAAGCGKEQDRPEDAKQDQPKESEPEEGGVKFVSRADAGLEDHVMDWKDDALEAWMQKSVSDISSLLELKSLEHLWYAGSHIEDSDLKALKENGVTLVPSLF